VLLLPRARSAITVTMRGARLRNRKPPSVSQFHSLLRIYEGRLSFLAFRCPLVNALQRHNTRGQTIFDDNGVRVTNGSLPLLRSIGLNLARHKLQQGIAIAITVDVDGCVH
jgi:hypothetical protein